MDTQNNVGVTAAFIECVCDLDVPGREAASLFLWCCYAEPGALAELVKALQESDKPTIREVLRRWRVWADNSEASLSPGGIQ